jgi:asparagine synthase (glutamine-hydrolysing)
MCGIWALIQESTINNIKPYINNINSIKSRGPDKTNIYIDKHLACAFHRLAIHDLSPLGDQPFIWFDNSLLYILIVNGEIYNYKELKNKYNIVTKSESDCEIIYYLFRILNGNIHEVIRELKGEFSFVFNIIFYYTNYNSDTVCETVSYVCRDPFGVRPLFYSVSDDKKKYIFSSLLSGVITDDTKIGMVFPPGKILVINKKSVINTYFISYYNYIYNNINTNINFEITSRLINAVKIRLDSEKPIGALLSGGLDSSLICGIISKILGVQNLNTFSIGMKKGTDLNFANKVALHLNTVHTEILFTPEEGLNAIDYVLDATETWDITTIRASVGQYLLGKYISTKTDIKVILNGDGADEVEMGYLYFYLAPNSKLAQEESVKLVKEIHKYDGLRVDRCISVHGLEARVPFLDIDFVNYYMGIDAELKIPTKARMEKQLIRDAFNELYPDILPKEVLYRKKEAFSDGISSKEKSWFEIIGEWIDTKITDEEFINRENIYNTCKTKESYYYKKHFINKFNKESLDVIPNYWLPKWINTNGEPSARVLEVYK